MFLLFLLAVISQAKLHHAVSYFDFIKHIESDSQHLCITMIIQDKDSSEQIVGLLGEYNKEMGDIINIIIVECSILTQNDKLQIPDCKAEPPQGAYLVPNGTAPVRKPMKRLSLSALRADFINYSPRHWTMMESSQQLEKFYEDHSMNKVIIKTQLSNNTWWFGISQEYKNEIQFGVTDLIDEDLVILKWQNEQWIKQKYRGAKRYLSLRAYLSQFASFKKNQFAEPELGTIRQIFSVNDINTTQWNLVQSGKQSYKFTSLLTEDLFQAYHINNYKNSKLEIFYNQTSVLEIKSQPLDEICSLLSEYLDIKFIKDQHQLTIDSQNLPNSGHTIITLFYSDEIPCSILYLETLSLKYTQFHYYLIKDPDQSLRDVFQINKLPQLSSYAINNGKVQGSTFDKEYVFYKISQYLHAVSSLQNQISIFTVQNQQEFEQLCSKENKQCVILISDDSEAHKDSAQKIAKSLQNSKYIWLSMTTCQAQTILKKYKLQEPTVILYDWINYKISTLPDILTHGNLLNFMKQKKRKWIEISYELQVYKCVNDL